jgi:spoIIIJ-associated protein
MNDQEQAIEAARKYLEDILSFFGLNIVVGVGVEEDVIELKVPSTHLNGFLIGQRGETLRALQALIGSMLKNSQASLVRVNIDVADYKQHRAERLLVQLEDWVNQVRSEKKDVTLHPMNAADRRTIHRGLEDYSDVSSRSDGEGRDRHIVLEFHAEKEQE